MNILVLIIIYLFLFFNIKIFKISYKTAPYIFLTPVIFINLIYFPSLKLLLVPLILTLSVGLTIYNSKKYNLLTLIIMLFLILSCKPEISVFRDQNTINQINSQRGEDIAIYKNLLIAKLAHNKSTLIFTLIKNTEQYLDPVKIFASANYPWLNHYYSLGYLFPWDLILIFYAIYLFVNQQNKQNNSKLLIGILSIIILIIPVSLGQNEEYSKIIATTLALFLLIISTKSLGKLNRKYTFFAYTLACLFNLLHLLTINQLIVR